MKILRSFLILAICCLPLATAAQDLSALARVDGGQSSLDDRGDDIQMTLVLSQGVPYRVFNLAEPNRMVIDFNEVDWAGLKTDAFDKSDRISAMRTGTFRPGWSRMVLDLAEPLLVRSASMTIEEGADATLVLLLKPSSDEEFAARAGTPPGAGFSSSTAPADVAEPKQRQTGDSPLVVVLDPGHGGIDPGAESEGTVEADLMLTFARELSEALLRAGSFDVVMTRQDDSFVPLEARVSIARAAGADVFLSLHADALAEGRASGATIYTLSDRASDVASEKLAERHDRADLLAGVDLSNQDDLIAGVLMDMARNETEPRSDNLADALVAGLSAKVMLHKHPKASAGFSVLKAPDIPSVLIELGFLSSPRDRSRLQDAEWRKLAAEGIRDALQSWAQTDAAEARLLRK